MKTNNNIIFSLLYLASSILSSFFLVPIFTKSMGVDVYGYVALGSMFISIAQILTIAITSMSTRYIVLSYHEDRSKANQCFNSIFESCILLAGILALIFLLIAVYIEKIVNIDYVYVSQMRIFVFFLGGSFGISVISCPFLSGQYYNNDLRVYYSFTGISQLSRILIAYLLFPILGPSMWLPYLAGFLIDIIALFVYIRLNRIMLPGVYINLRFAQLSIIKEIFSKGIWASINKSGAILLSSVSKYFANIFLTAIESGYYSSFLQLQQMFSSFTTAVVNALVPNMIKAYASDPLNGFFLLGVRNLKYFSMSLGLLCGIAVSFAVPFFDLWLGKSTAIYNIPIVLLIGYLPFSYPTEVINQMLIIQVRIKIPAIVTVCFGLTTLILTVLFCKVLGLGMIGIIIAQLISQITRSWLFLPRYVAMDKKIYIHKMHMSQLFGPIALGVSMMICHFLKRFIPYAYSWSMFILDCGVCLCICVVISPLLLTQNERKQLWSLVRKILSKLLRRD